MELEAVKLTKVTDSHNPTFKSEAVERIIGRAAELSKHEPTSTTSHQFSLSELIEIASEADIPPECVRTAVTEELEATEPISRVPQIKDEFSEKRIGPLTAEECLVGTITFLFSYIICELILSLGIATVLVAFFASSLTWSIACSYCFFKMRQ